MRTTKIESIQTWKVTSKGPDGVLLGHGREFRTEEAAGRLFDNVFAKAPKGTKVMLNVNLKTITITTEKKTKTWSLTV